MTKSIDIAAIILAAGKGDRYDKKHLKQYENINGKPVLYYSVEPFIKNNIDLVYVVINEKHIEYAENALQNLRIDKFVFGGKTRQESVFNALMKLKKYNPNKVIIHDSARPNVTDLMINKVIKYLNTYDAVVPVIKINDAVKKLNYSKFIKEDIDKDKLVLVQTPQGFKFENILKSHMNNKVKNVNDDTVLIDKNTNKIFTFNGDFHNIKITTKKDLQTIKSLKKNNIKYYPISSLGIDVHRFNKTSSKNNYIILGSTKIRYKKSLIGHSDADVVLHALVDSILGTIAEGDIGNKFPDTERKWKNVNSKIFLDYALKRLKNNNCKIIHLDITIICQEPKIDPHRNIIRNKISKLLNISKKNISLKATTTEKLGYLGRGEGVMAQCLITVLKPYKDEIL